MHSTIKESIHNTHLAVKILSISNYRFFFCSLVFESPMRASKIVQSQVQSRMKENQPKRRSCHSQLIDRMRTLNSFITFLLQQNWKLKIINSPIARNPKAKNGIVHSIQPNKLNALLRLMDALISLHYISLQWGFFLLLTLFFLFNMLFQMCVLIFTHLNKRIWEK